MKNKKLVLDDDFSLVMICAFRYALGRMTYVMSTVPEFIEKNIEKVLTKDIELMCREITEYEEQNCLGMSCDKKNWIDFREFLEEELEERKEK